MEQHYVKNSFVKSECTLGQSVYAGVALYFTDARKTSAQYLNSVTISKIKTFFLVI